MIQRWGNDTRTLMADLTIRRSKLRRTGSSGQTTPTRQGSLESTHGIDSIEFMIANGEELVVNFRSLGRKPGTARKQMNFALINNGL